MKKIEVTYMVNGYLSEVIEVDDDMTIDEIEEMCYREFPPIENYHVDIFTIEEDDDDDEA